MDMGLVLGDASLVDERLDPRVVVGQAGEHTVTEQVAAGVTDVRDTELLAVEESPAHRRTHPVQGHIVGDELGEAIVGLLQRAAQYLEHLGALVEPIGLLELGDGDSGGEISGGRAAHAVGNDHHRRGRIARVLVVLPHQADLGVCDRAQGERHQVSSLIWVRPILRLSAAVTTVGVTTLTSLTKVPLVDPRSVTTHSPPERRAREAWSPDT
jgi:hypothetical protein